jgi:hypothetical protein
MKKLIVGMMMLVFVSTGIVFGGAAKAEKQIDEPKRFYSAFTSDDNSLIGQNGNVAMRSSNPILGSLDEVIHFSRRESNQRMTSPALPRYITAFGCGPTSGGVLIAYHNRTLPNLIPGHVAGQQIGNNFLWANQNNSPLLTQMFSTLNSMMNPVNGGVTTTQYYGAIAVYTFNQGHTAATVTTNSGSNAINNNFIDAIANNRPIVMFMNNYNLVSYDPYSTYDHVRLTHFGGSHILTAYGYDIVSYFDANNHMFRQDTYAFVNDGFGSLSRVRINTHSEIFYSGATTFA